MRKLLSSVIVLALLFNLFCIPVGAAEGAAYTVWVPSNSEKVLLDQLPPSEINNVVDIKSARNEYEGAQVIIHAGDSDLENVSVTISDLTDGNNTISYGNIGIFRECYINVTQSSTEGLLPGWYPDALVPLTGEFSIPANKNQGIWFSVKVPKGFPSGQYSGSISISGAGINETIPVNLTVWDFELTDENHYQSCFQIWFSQMLSQYPGITDPNSPEAWAMYKNYYDFMIDHRLAPSSLPVDEEEGRTDIPSYIAKIKPYIEDSRISAYAIPYYMNSDGSFDKTSTTNLVMALNNAGLLSKGYFYVIDEPDLNSSQDIQRIKDLGNYINGLNSVLNTKIKNVVTSTTGVVDSLSDYVNTWCPDYGCFTSQSQWDKVDARHEAGDSVWWYGCCWPRYPFPTYHIDDFMQGTRILSWMQKYHNIDGQLYWSVDIFKKYINGAYIPRDVWNDPVAFVGGLERPVNGDGFLLYPGPDGPYSTLRLEAIRDGNEDYEYLWLLDQLVAQTNEKLGTSITSKELLKDVYDMLFSSINDYTKNPEYIKIAREQVANTIMSLSKDPSGLVKIGNTYEDTAETAIEIYTDTNTTVKVNGTEISGSAFGDKATKYVTSVQSTDGLNQFEVEFKKGEATNTVTKQFIVGQKVVPPTPKPTTASLTALKAGSSINIDGRLDETEWKLDNEAKLVLDATDNTAKFGTLWDDQYVYFGFDVTDGNVVNSNAEYPWNDDSIEIYLDGDLVKQEYNEHCVQYIFRFDDNDVYVYGPGNSNKGGIIHKAEKTTTGYQMEIAIPWSTLGISPATVLVNNDCSSLKSIVDASGFVEPAQIGWYAVDNGKTLGQDAYNNAVPSPMDVDPGNILFYHDKSANGDYINSWFTVRVEKDVDKIQNNPWTMDFRMKIEDLIKYTSYEDKRVGFGTFVNTGTSLYRVVFSPDNKIRVFSKDTVYEKDADIHMGDGKFHNWSISGDGRGNLDVVCDNVKVASFSNIDYTYSMADDSDLKGAGFRSYCIENVDNAGLSGNNEVYLDSFKLTARKIIGFATHINDKDEADAGKAANGILTFTPNGPDWQTSANWAELELSDAGNSTGEVSSQNEIFRDDCTSLETGWTRMNDNSVNNFIGDSTLSGQADKVIPEGQYLIYGAEADKFARVRKEGITVGNGPWYAEFDAHIVDLMTPTNNFGWRGFYFEFIVNKKDYKITFSGKDENNNINVYAKKNDGTFIEKSVTLPADNNFHKWRIECDGAQCIRLYLDNSEVAVFEGLDATESLPDMIDMGTSTDDMDMGAGKTEIYIDSFVVGNFPLAAAKSALTFDTIKNGNADTGNVTSDLNLITRDETNEVDISWSSSNTNVISNDGKVTRPVGSAQDVQVTLTATLIKGAVKDTKVFNLIVKKNNIQTVEPGDTITAETGKVYMFNKVDEMLCSNGKSFSSSQWSRAPFTYDGLTTGGTVIENETNAEALTLPLTLNGWFGVYVGYANGTQEFSVIADGKTQPVTVSYSDFSNVNLYGSQMIYETFSTASNFENNTVTIMPSADKKARIAYIKLVGLSEEQVQLYQKPDEGVDGKRLMFDNDGFTDFFWGKYPSIDALKELGIDKLVTQAGAGELNWCLGTTGMLNYNSEFAGNAFEGSERFDDQLRQGDKLARQQILNILTSGKSPLEILAQRGDELGVKVNASLRMEAFYNPETDGFFNGKIFDTLKQNCLQKDDDYLMSYTSEEFRDYIINILNEVATFNGVDGVTLDFARYPWVIGNEVPTLEGKKAVMTQFMRDVRSALAGKDITVRVPYNEWQTYGLDIETWVAEGLIDRLIPSVRSYEDFYSIQRYVDMVKGTNVKLYIGITADLSGSDLTKEQEELMRQGKYVPNNKYLSIQQYLSRTYEAYEAGADGVFLFNTLNDIFFINSISPKYKLLGDKVKMEKWHEFEYPAEQVQSTITINPADSVFYDNCSSLADAGWEVRYKQNTNLFVGDSSQSTVYQRVIPAGQYMFYADATDNDTSAISKALDIGAGPLCLEFDAKFKNLQTPGKNEGWRGFVLEIAANGKDYRLALNSMDPAGNAKIYIRKNDDNEFLVKDVTLPTDDNFHRWSISCDDNGGVTVFIDNKPVALFTGITLTGGSDALYIYNDMSDRSTGNNEIYIENINLRKPAEADYSGYTALAMEVLTFDKIKNSNTDSANIISDLSLPTSDSEAGVAISWSSSNTNVIDNNGKVTRPASNSQDTSVTLTATFTKGSSTDTRIFNLVVKKIWSDNGATTPPTSDSGSATPLTIVDGTVKVEPKLQSDGIAAADINTEDLEKAFKQVTTDVNGVKQVKIELKAVEGSKLYIQRLPSSAVASGNKNEKIEIKTSLGTIVVPGNMFNSNDVKQVQNIGIAIGLADKSNIDKTLMKKIGNKPVVEINASADGKTIAWNNPDAPVKVSVDYSPTAEELKDPEHIVVWYIDGEGKAVAVPDGRYDNTTGKVTFTTTHFSKYAVAFVHKTFSDITGCEWARKQIEVLASKGVINGTTETTYEPDMPITRADFLVLLVKTLGLTAKVQSNFDDVEKNAYYYEAVGIAKKLGITSGVGGNKFNPNDPILRQDMMTLVAKALKVAGKAAVTGGITDLTGFSDASIISPYAVESVAALVKEGVIQGSGNMINPLGNTTRAEIAVLVYRLYYK